MGRQMKGDRTTGAADDFVEQMKKVPLEAFVRMLDHSGIPREEAREVAEAFRRIRE